MFSTNLDPVTLMLLLDENILLAGLETLSWRESLRLGASTVGVLMIS